MATAVYDIVDLELSNGEILQIRPLPIKPLRKFMAVIEKLDSIENEAQALDIFIEAGMICVSYFNQELAKDKDTFEVFLLGHWKNYDDLENELSIDELLATLKAVRDKEHRNNKFLAAMQGIDLEEEKEDITTLKGIHANKEGFGIGMGLGYVSEG